MQKFKYGDRIYEIDPGENFRAWADIGDRRQEILDKPFLATLKEEWTKIILSDDIRAACFRSDIKGWVSRDGRYYGNDERLARASGATHCLCEDCGIPIDVKTSGYIRCSRCREAKGAAAYAARPRKEWDEKGMLYSDFEDRFFDSWSDVFDYAEDHETTAEKLRLVICEPVYLRRVDPDYWEHDLPEEGDLPDEALVLLDEFNEAMRQFGPVSWMPGDFAPVLPEFFTT